MPTPERRKLSLRQVELTRLSWFIMVLTWIYLAPETMPCTQCLPIMYCVWLRKVREEASRGGSG